MSGLNFSFVTLEYLEAYGNRLRWNSVMNIPINGLAAIIILKYSTPAMGSYKYFIFATIFSAFFMDFHSSFIYGFYNFLPLASSCPTGIAKKWGWFWGTYFNFTFFHFTMSFCGLSLTYSILYQYYSLTKDTEIFRKTKTVVAMILLVILYPMPAAVMYYFSVDHEKGQAYIFKNHPDIAKIFVAGSCSMQILSTPAFIYFLVAAAEVFLLFAFAVIVGWKLALKLEQVKHSLSVATLAAHKQYIYALYIQGTVPFLFIVIPILFMIFGVILNLSNARDSFELAYQCFGLHSCGNAIAVLFIIKPYRRALIKWYQTFIGFFYKKPIVQIQPINSCTSLSTIAIAPKSL